MVGSDPLTRTCREVHAMNPNVSKSIQIGDPRLPARFWSKVGVSKAGCWVWIASIGSHGYGQITIDGAPRLAHRLAYEALVGTISEGLECDHLCRVRACCNPCHIEPVTHRENSRRGIGPAAMNARKTHCDSGHSLSGDNLHITPDGYRRCRACFRAHQASRRRENGDDVREYERTNRAKNRAHVNDVHRKWRAANPERMAEYNRRAKQRRALAAAPAEGEQT